jgi:UDPglucose--hexose-1-phosphate uridylyltransferase
LTQLRQDPLAGHWVIVSEDRSSRPIRTKAPPRSEPRGGWLCPFCEGNESTTPPEVEAKRSARSEPNAPGWSIRTVPNKFAALRPDASGDPAKGDLLEAVPGFGIHEVIIESPQHQAQMNQFSRTKLADILAAYRSRIRSLYEDKRIRYVQIFRNEGYLAGASLEHPHTQVLGLPLVPDVIQAMVNRAAAHQESKRGCLTCAIIKRELAQKERVVFEGKRFVALAPFASRVPGEIALFPREHQHRFEESSDDALSELAAELLRCLHAMRQAFDNPPFNLILITAPRAEGKAFPEKQLARTFHWHFQFVPRTTRPAGLELGTGLNLNPVAPESSARRLREALRDRATWAGTVKR